MDREAFVQRVNQIQDEVGVVMSKRLENAISDAMLDAAMMYPQRRSVFVPDDHRLRIEDALYSGYEDVTRKTGAEIIGMFKDGFTYLQIEGKDEAGANEGLFRRLWEQFISAFGARRVAQITETTRSQIADIVQRGLKDGLGVDEIAKAIREKAPTFSALRSAVISRTELHSSAMYASTNVAKASSVQLLKEWVSVEDGRTRDFGEGDGVIDEFSHRAMDGVQVPIDDPYVVPSALGFDDRLMYPGDPTGAAANIINCRCAQTYVRA